MNWQSEVRTEKMGEFHNQLVELLDSSVLEPQDIIVILRMVANNVEKLFETAVKTSKKSKEQADGG